MAKNFLNPKYEHESLMRRFPPPIPNKLYQICRTKYASGYGLKLADDEKSNCKFCSDEEKRGVKDSSFILEGSCPLPTALKKNESTENKNHILVIPLHRCWTHLDACMDLLESEWPTSGDYRKKRLQQSRNFFPTSLVLILRTAQLVDYVVGHCRINPVDKVPDVCFMESVLIAKQFRGKGWGRFLMSEAEGYAVRRGATIGYVRTTKDKEIFYNKLGYVGMEAIRVNASLSKSGKQMFLKDVLPGIDADFRVDTGKSYPIYHVEAESSASATTSCNLPMITGVPILHPSLRLLKNEKGHDLPANVPTVLMKKFFYPEDSYCYNDGCCEHCRNEVIEKREDPDYVPCESDLDSDDEHTVSDEWYTDEEYRNADSVRDNDWVDADSDDDSFFLNKRRPKKKFRNKYRKYLRHSSACKKKSRERRATRRKRIINPAEELKKMYNALEMNKAIKEFVDRLARNGEIEFIDRTATSSATQQDRQEAHSTSVEHSVEQQQQQEEQQQEQQVSADDMTTDVDYTDPVNRVEKSSDGKRRYYRVQLIAKGKHGAPVDVCLQYFSEDEDEANTPAKETIPESEVTVNETETDELLSMEKLTLEDTNETSSVEITEDGIPTYVIDDDDDQDGVGSDVKSDNTSYRYLGETINISDSSSSASSDECDSWVTSDDDYEGEISKPHTEEDESEFSSATLTTFTSTNYPGSALEINTNNASEDNSDDSEVCVVAYDNTIDLCADDDESEKMIIDDDDDDDDEQKSIINEYDSRRSSSADLNSSRLTVISSNYAKTIDSSEISKFDNGCSSRSSTISSLIRSSGDSNIRKDNVIKRTHSSSSSSNSTNSDISDSCDDGKSNFSESDDDDDDDDDDSDDERDEFISSDDLYNSNDSIGSNDVTLVEDNDLKTASQDTTSIRNASITSERRPSSNSSSDDIEIIYEKKKKENTDYLNTTTGGSSSSSSSVEIIYENIGNKRLSAENSHDNRYPAAASPETILSDDSDDDVSSCTNSNYVSFFDKVDKERLKEIFQDEDTSSVPVENDQTVIEETNDNDDSTITVDEAETDDELENILNGQLQYLQRSISSFAKYPLPDESDDDSDL